jgi:hypothetical protein
MAERVTNDFATVLAQALSNTGTTVTVGAAPPSDLTTGNFRVRVENADANGNPTGVNVEFMNVTALGNPTTIWTVTRQAENADRFPAVAHPAGSIVTHVLTAAALTTLVAAGPSGSGATQAGLDAEAATRASADTALSGRVATLEAGGGVSAIVTNTGDPDPDPAAHPEGTLWFDLR